MNKKGIRISVNEIVEITFGTLLNKPSISFFEQLCYEVESVEKGALFIAYDAKDIEVAIQKGAFGILFSGEIAMSDEEVAWISVESLEEALFRILRHYLIIHNKILFSLSQDEYELSSQIFLPKKNLSFFSGSLIELINHILKTSSVYILALLPLSYQNKLQQQQEIKVFSNKKISEESLPFMVTSYSLFGIKIFYHSMDYELPLPKPFFQLLARVLNFAEEYSLSVDLNKLEGVSSFKPLYLDERGFISKPGATNRVLLACEDVKLYEQYLAYFTMYAKWAKLMLFVPNIYHEIYSPYGEVYGYEDKEALFGLLLEKHYNFALILGENTKVFEERFQSCELEQNLFDWVEK
ncbi:hypothetical protein [Helicobacter mesocricetorum]|uniref:hypothetical protein n=1 Tax=Helicobacter mesocricetorum TaxID=87012 RepID=UPI000CF04A55|nr:hypothetical protein [Helicobacter mesocricetorum]